MVVYLLVKGVKSGHQTDPARDRPVARGVLTSDRGRLASSSSAVAENLDFSDLALAADDIAYQRLDTEVRGGPHQDWSELNLRAARSRTEDHATRIGAAPAARTNEDLEVRWEQRRPPEHAAGFQRRGH